MAGQFRIDAGGLSTMLAARIDVLAAELLPGGRRNGAEWRCGSLAGEKGGSLAVQLSGSKAGFWCDHASGEGGDALDLVAQCLTRGNKSEACKWASKWLGLSDGADVEIHRAHLVKERAKRDDKHDEIEGRKVALAMWIGAEPIILDTPVDFYLGARGIDLRRFDRAPRCLRFAPAHYCNETRRKYPAMLAAITALNGEHIATHQTWLERDPSGRWTKARLEVPKKVRGRMAGGMIRLRKGASGTRLLDASPEEPVVIGEGIETCLSAAIACPELRVLAAVSLGNMRSTELPDNVKRVILLGDNDTNPKAQAAFQKVVDAHLQAGREVRVARSPRGKDFNDAIQ